MAKLRRIKRK